ncbi:hypothetical protein COTS27_01185 [Spirochaetota bacterium]|nr:hypothetical protein COTS27_01185 [Spirochaetota bacterium]
MQSPYSKRNIPPLQKIDLLATIKQESPKLAAKLTKPYYAPLMFLIKRLVNEKGLNEHVALLHRRLVADDNLSHLDNLSYYLYEYLKINLRVKGHENIPTKTAVGKSLIFAANHSLGVLDGLTLVEVLSRRYGDARILANRLVLLTQVFNYFMLPVGVFKRTNREESIAARTLYESQIPISIFPAGLVARKDNNKILREQPWKKHFLQKAIEFKRDIVPTHMENENSRVFYMIHRLRMALGIKANLEMFLLVREFVNARRKSITIRFGRPISYQHLEKCLQKSSSVHDKNTMLNTIAEKMKVHVESGLVKPLNL